MQKLIQERARLALEREQTLLVALKGLSDSFRDLAIDCAGSNPSNWDSWKKAQQAIANSEDTTQ